LKHHLGISSDEFLDDYIDIVLRPNSFFPDVFLRMAEDTEKSCPFLTGSGCSVYPERPDTCRGFPLERGIIYDAATRKSEMICFYRPPGFCKGRHESREWTPKSWLENQQVDFDRKIYHRWTEIRRRFQSDPWGTEGPEGPKAKMAFMAAYNVDRFHDFVFNSSFLKRYRVKPAIRKQIRKDDLKLLEFGFEWIKLYLWGIRSSMIKV
jgi:Fe-S-cluster containining protein